MDAELNKRLERIEKKLALLLQKPEKATWIKAATVMELTGWDKEAMRRARQSGLVEQVKNEKGIFYKLESINPVFIRKEVA